MYTSDWHIHSEASYDAALTLPELFAATERQDIRHFGITDHMNWPSWIPLYLRRSRELFEENRRPGFHLGVELTTRSKYKHDYDRLHGGLEGWSDHDFTQPDPIELPMTAEEIAESGVEYTIGAAHWALNVPMNPEDVVRDFTRQTFWLAQDPRVDIIGHPFAIAEELRLSNGTSGHFTEFSLGTPALRRELAAAFLEGRKLVECNIGYLQTPYLPEQFRHDYAEFMRELFESGVPITIGTDCHGPNYPDVREFAARYLSPAGFQAQDFAEPACIRRAIR